MVHHLVERSIDMLLDPRLPHAIPYNIWRKWRYNSINYIPVLNQPLHICLTFDIEHDFRNPTSFASTERFLPFFLNWAVKYGWHSTLYVEGNLLPKLSTLILEAQQEHEIGLHGLHHEVWGRSRWWQYNLGFAGIDAIEKHKRLLDALDRFDCSGLSRPKSFRAPYLNLDSTARKLLVQNNFTSDSSASCFYGVLPIPTKQTGLWVVPITASPRPLLSLKGARYLELTLGNMMQMSKEQFLEVIFQTLKLQSQANTKFPPHLVILAHPWEFENNSGLTYASNNNWQRLANLIGIIADYYEIVFTTISELVSYQSLPFSIESNVTTKFNSTERT